MNKYLDTVSNILNEPIYNFFSPIFGLIGCIIGFLLFIPCYFVMPLFRCIYLMFRGLWEEINE